MTKDAYASMNQERMRYDQILQEAVAQQAKEVNKRKARVVMPDSEEELTSSPSEEWNSKPVARAAAGHPSNGAVARELKTCAPVHGCL
ncbi:hypothetical protein PIB30_092491 [Stylosanthes scabra]|uniref:Uncharacterized protein n=1 Tax=Stylosanthes scabra TaxID=79078 RepID=A0ABU6WT72_9FABA|nr:hypothetical protein [Stylosanthes scabra]